MGWIMDKGMTMLVMSNGAGGSRAVGSDSMNDHGLLPINILLEG
jgi:hypothetical protein